MVVKSRVALQLHRRLKMGPCVSISSISKPSAHTEAPLQPAAAPYPLVGPLHPPPTDGCHHCPISYPRGNLALVKMPFPNLEGGGRWHHHLFRSSKLDTLGWLSEFGLDRFARKKVVGGQTSLRCTISPGRGVKDWTYFGIENPKQNCIYLFGKRLFTPRFFATFWIWYSQCR